MHGQKWKLGASILTLLNVLLSSVQLLGLRNSIMFVLQVPVTVPASDSTVQTIIQTSEAIVIPHSSALGKASNHRVVAGPMAAVRLPLLHVSYFKGGTPEVVSASYAILVLVLPGESGRVWTPNEIEMVEVVADQVNLWHSCW